MITKTAIKNQKQHLKSKKMNTKFKIIEMYLDYVNNFISVQAFADYYGLNTVEANIIINAGRELNNN